MCQTIESQPASMKTICANPYFLFSGLTLNPLLREIIKMIAKKAICFALMLLGALCLLTSMPVGIVQKKKFGFYTGEPNVFDFRVLNPIYNFRLFLSHQIFESSGLELKPFCGYYKLISTNNRSLDYSEAFSFGVSDSSENCIYGREFVGFYMPTSFSNIQSGEYQITINITNAPPELEIQVIYMIAYSPLSCNAFEAIRVKKDQGQTRK